MWSCNCKNFIGCSDPNLTNYLSTNQLTDQFLAYQSTAQLVAIISQMKNEMGYHA